MPILRLEQATKLYKWDDRIRAAVKEVDLTIQQGEFVFFVGSSGAGKSTLLKLLCGELRPDRGGAFLDDQDLSRVPGWRRAKIRRNFGAVWQESVFMRKRTIYENLEIVARIGTRRGSHVRERVSKALAVVGMPGVEERYPVELSIGECRRVELARALINGPPILIIDEITANLDIDTTWDIFHLLMELHRKGTTILMATHASDMVNIMRQRVVTLVDGHVFADVKKGKYGDIV